ncbi:hypothetical protein BJY04DRAFT_180560 [Aspergillus karnatakaensis]|uniref:uncharacterized protein n=1 Tax=Aspergillus karnatakaensis TaxID=1810916 RepID=UPI003CCD46E1
MQVPISHVTWVTVACPAWSKRAPSRSRSTSTYPRPRLLLPLHLFLPLHLPTPSQTFSPYAALGARPAIPVFS